MTETDELPEGWRMTDTGPVHGFMAFGSVPGGERLGMTIGGKDRAAVCAAVRDVVSGDSAELRRRIAAQRVEIRELHVMDSVARAAAFHAEAKVYRKALSNLLHRLTQGQLMPATAAEVIRAALDLRGKGRAVNPRKRAEIYAAHVTWRREEFERVLAWLAPKYMPGMGEDVVAELVEEYLEDCDIAGDAWADAMREAEGA